MAGSRTTAGSGLNFTQFEVWLYDYYKKNGMLNALMYEVDPLFSMLNQKRVRVQGKQIVQNIKYTRNPNSSRQFSVAQEHAKSMTSARATFTYKTDRDFAVARVDNEVIYASQGSTYAFIEAYKQELDDVLSAAIERRADDLWGAGTSRRGLVRSVSGKTVTLSDASSLLNFDQNDKIQFYASGASSTATARTHGSGNSARTVFTISSVGRSRTTPTITFTEDLPTTLVANDQIFKQGDFNQLSFEGIASILPLTAPAANDNVFSFDRSVAPERLSGVRGTMANSDTYDSFLRDMMAEISILTGKPPSTLWVNPIRENSIIDELGDKVRYNTMDQSGDKGYLGFSGVSIITPKGQMKLMSSPRVPVNTMYGLNMDTFELRYMSAPGNGFVDFIPVGGAGKDGKSIISYDDAGLEARVESYGALICDAPGCNFIVNATAKTL